AGISEGVSARRPRFRSRRGELRATDAAENRRGRKPATNRAAVMTAVQNNGPLIVSFGSKRRIFGRPGLAFRFVGPFRRECRFVGASLGRPLLGIVLPVGGFFPLAGRQMRD